METFVGRVVAGGPAMIGGLWMVALASEPGLTEPVRLTLTAGGIAIAVTRLGVALAGIRRELSI